MLALTNRQFLLKYQKEVFEHFLGDTCIHKEYKNPLRPDNSAGCSLVYYNGRLRLTDFASSKIHYDAYDLVMGYYNVGFYEAKSIIQNSFAGLGSIVQTEDSSDKKHSNLIFSILKDGWSKIQKEYWANYQITIDQLEQDKVIPVKEFTIIRNGNVLYSRTMLDTQFAFAYNEWEESIYKICCPFISGKGKWITNTNQNHIGNAQNIDFVGEHLVITKSYKDCRVLRNNGFENTIWLQNEGMIPSKENLESITSMYDKITILFDNDQAGIVASQKLADFLTHANIRQITVPKNFKKYGVKDPSDLLKFNEKKFNQFLKKLSWQ